MIPPVQRQAATVLVLAICSVVMVSCGGNGTTRSMSSGDINPSAAPTHASATAYAHLVNLRTADVPGMSAVSAEGERPQTPSSSRSSAEFARCFGGVSPNARLVKIHSPEFSAGHAAQSQTAQSTVEVWPTAALAARNNASYFSSRGRKCFLRSSEAMRREISKRVATKLQLGPVRIATVAAPLPGTSRGRLTIDETLLHDGRVRVHVFHDIFTFISGPAEIELETTGFSKPVPTAMDERLLTLLLNRAKTTKP